MPCTAAEAAGCAGASVCGGGAGTPDVPATLSVPWEQGVTGKDGASSESPTQCLGTHVLALLSTCL